MRRIDRQIVSLDGIQSVLSRCTAAVLSLCDGDTPYAIPLNFGFSRSGDTFTFYFHSAKEGKKLDIIRQNPTACLNVFRIDHLILSDTACSNSCAYESVIATGQVTLLDDPNDKASALQCILKHATKKDMDIPAEQLDHVCVYQLDAKTISGKHHL